MANKKILARFKGKKIGVLMGGRSGEREVSLRSGANVLAALKRHRLNAVAVDAGPDIAGVLTRQRIDAAFIVLHGRYGEDGTIQGLLELMGIPYTGSGVLASALAMNKGFTKKIFQQEGVPTPDFRWVRKGEDPKQVSAEVVEALNLPLVLKPLEEGSSLGISIVKQTVDTVRRLGQIQRKYGDALVERFIPGMAVTVGILGTGARARALPVLELVTANEFYDYQAKYTPGKTEFHVPARLPGSIYKRTQETALAAYQALQCRGWGRVDAIVDRSGTPYVLEVNTIPGMTDLSDLPAEAAAEGMSYDDLVLEILDSARG